MYSFWLSPNGPLKKAEVFPALPLDRQLSSLLCLPSGSVARTSTGSENETARRAIARRAALVFLCATSYLRCLATSLVISGKCQPYHSRTRIA